MTDDTTPVEHKCSARSKQTGKPCKQPAIPGGTVCRYHGGAAPQVKEAARLRLAALVDPAIDKLTKLLKQNKVPTVAMAAVKEVLSVNGLSGSSKVELSGPDGGPIETSADFSKLSLEQLEQLRALVAAVSRESDDE